MLEGIRKLNHENIGKGPGIHKILEAKKKLLILTVSLQFCFKVMVVAQNCELQF